MATQIYAPHSYAHIKQPKVFLAGSIDNGQAEDWQNWLYTQLTAIDVALLNPRRPDWDSSLKPESDNASFREQVEWELKGLRDADLIVMYFAPTSKAPITLLELGLFANSGKLVVCCPEGYWRRGNVMIVCEQYKTKCVASIQELLAEIKFLAQK